MGLPAQNVGDISIAWIGNRYLTTNYQRAAPIIVEPSYVKLSSSNGFDRFKLSVKVTLDITDSLYVQGASYVIGSGISGHKNCYQDSVESCNQEYAILNENNVETTFTIYLEKSHLYPLYTLSFIGGRIDEAFPLLRIKTASFNCTYNISFGVTFFLIPRDQIISPEQKPVMRKEN
jgi:hypothetical protein